LSDEAMKIFEMAGAVKEGHFLLTSGLHSPVYWEKFRILQYPNYTEKLCQLIAQYFKELDLKVELIAGPTTGGIIVAFETARQMGVKGIFAEKEEGIRVFRRDFNIAPDERVLIVDDILTTGSSIRGTMSAVRKLGGIVIGVGVLVNRSAGEIDFGVPLFSCVRSSAVVYRADECPLCVAHIPLIRLGS